MNVLKITIELTSQGQIRVQSTTPDRVVTFGLIEAAKFAIAAGEKEGIIVPEEDVVVPFPPPWKK